MSLGKPALLSVQFVLGIYGGYFGGALGLMMLAVWTVFGGRDLIAMSASRILVVGLTNAIAVVFFIAIGTIYWNYAVVMLVAGGVGGYVGAIIAKRLPVHTLRTGISSLNFVITILFFWKTYW
jgi:uncharacterized membrane protein YfcA